MRNFIYSLCTLSHPEIISVLHRDEMWLQYTIVLCCHTQNKISSKIKLYFCT